MDAQTIALIVTTVLALLGAGIITKLALLIKETKELFVVLSDAVADGEITAKELAQILKEALDVKDAVGMVFEIIRGKTSKS